MNNALALAVSIRCQLRDLQQQLGYDSADPLVKMEIQRVILSWLQLHTVERNLANDTGNSKLSNLWLKWHRQAASLYDAAVRSLNSLRKCESLWKKQSVKPPRPRRQRREPQASEAGPPVPVCHERFQLASVPVHVGRQ